MKRTLRTVLGILLAVLMVICMKTCIDNAPHGTDIGTAPAPAPVETPVIPEQPQPSELVTEPEPSAEPTPEPTPDPNSPEGRALALGLPVPPDIDITSWEYILANGEHSISEYAPPEIQYLESQPLDSRIIEPIQRMAEDTRAQGLNVYLSSGYRSYSDQAANFIRVCELNGVSDGKTASGFYITMPAGCSEHQTGLACDITDVYYPVKNSSIENTATFQYMSQHCQEFGFILRFPKDKENVTGVMYEPFHYRYVGIEAATYIMENGLCLEEFISLYTGEDLSAMK